MNDNPPTQTYIVVTKGTYIALAHVEEMGHWELISGVFREDPTEEKVELMLKERLFNDITVLKLRRIGAYRDCPVFECKVADFTRAKDFKFVRFWTRTAIEQGVIMGNVAINVIPEYVKTA